MALILFLHLTRHAHLHKTYCIVSLVVGLFVLPLTLGASAIIPHGFRM
jgi:hypothetical protein